MRSILLALLFAAFGPTALHAQEAPDGAPPVRDNDCDAIWDGPLFGILPGIGVGMVGASVGSCGETADGCGDYLVKWGIAGAGVGLLLDQLHCAKPRAPDRRIDPVRSGIPFDPEFRFTAQPAPPTRSDSR